MCKFLCFFILCFSCLSSISFAQSIHYTHSCKNFFVDTRTAAFDSRHNLLRLINTFKRLKNFKDLHTSFLLDTHTHHKFILVSPTSADLSGSKTAHYAKDELLDLDANTGKVQVAQDEAHNPLLQDLLLRTDKTSNLLKERAKSASIAIEKEISESADIKKWEHRFVKAWTFMFYIPPTTGIITSYFVGFDVGLVASAASYYPAYLLRKFIIKKLDQREESIAATTSELPQYLIPSAQSYNHALHDKISQDIAHHFLAYSREQDPFNANVLVLPHTLTEKVLHYLKTHLPTLQQLNIEDLQLIYEEHGLTTP